ncbi:MAG: REP-associated tyrosine transposase [Fluviicola sp.]|jgi:REP element-mobilizing transposase RayT
MLSGQKLTIKNPNGSYYMTLTIVGWVDIFTRECYQKIIIEALKYYIKNKGLHIYSYCIMSNHIHLIANTDFPISLSDVMRDFKKHTSKQIILAIQSEPESRREWLLNYFKDAAEKHSKNKSFKFWQDGNHAIELYNERFTWTKIQYIHNNPVRAGLVVAPEYWKYSSAGHYQEMESVLPDVVRIAAPLNFNIF